MGPWLIYAGCTCSRFIASTHVNKLTWLIPEVANLKVDILKRSQTYSDSRSSSLFVHSFRLQIHAYEEGYTVGLKLLVVVYGIATFLTMFIFFYTSLSLVSQFSEGFCTVHLGVRVGVRGINYREKLNIFKIIICKEFLNQHFSQCSVKILKKIVIYKEHKTFSKLFGGGRG